MGELPFDFMINHQLSQDLTLCGIGLSQNYWFAWLGCLVTERDVI